MQATLTSLAEVRPYPLLSRLASLVPFQGRGAQSDGRGRNGARPHRREQRRGGARWSD
jgi:hypothetical protein